MRSRSIDETRRPRRDATRRSCGRGRLRAAMTAEMGNDSPQGRSQGAIDDGPTRHGRPRAGHPRRVASRRHPARVRPFRRGHGGGTAWVAGTSLAMTAESAETILRDEHRGAIDDGPTRHGRPRTGHPRRPASRRDPAQSRPFRHGCSGGTPWVAGTSPAMTAESAETILREGHRGAIDDGPTRHGRPRAGHPWRVASRRDPARVRPFRHGRGGETPWVAGTSPAMTAERDE